VNEFALHLDETLGGAQARVKLVGGKRQLQHVVGPAIQSLDELFRVQRPANEADVEGPLETLQQARFPADFRPRRGVTGLDHDHGVDVVMGGRMDQRLLRVCETNDVVDGFSRIEVSARISEGSAATRTTCIGSGSNIRADARKKTRRTGLEPIRK
jgi:hypothetical protein